MNANTEKKTWFMRPPKFKNRMLIMIVGIILQGYGLSLLIRLNLGTDPCTMFTLGVESYLQRFLQTIPALSDIPTFGICQLLCHSITFILVVIFDRSKIGFGTIGNMVCLGFIVDFFTMIWDVVIPTGFFDGWMGILFFIPVLTVFIGGAAAYMTADLGMSPYDGLPFILSEKLPKVPFKVVRIGWDGSYLILAVLLGQPITIVSVCIVLFLGPVISLVQKKLARFIL